MTGSGTLTPPGRQSPAAWQWHTWPTAAPPLSTAAAFPAAAILGIKIELLLGGTWTDVTSFTYSRNPVVITAGRPDEAATHNSSEARLTLNNQDGRFSPKNTAGAYYPFLTRNTQLRISVATTFAGGYSYSGYRFWGEVSAWPPLSDPSVTDIYVDVTASGIWRRLQQGAQATIGTAMYRYYSTLPAASLPVAYWPCEDGSQATSFASAASNGSAMTWTGTPGLAADSTSFAGSKALPQLNGSAWTGPPGSSSVVSSPATYSAAGTYSWLCPGDVTSLTSAEVWGSGSGGTTAAGAGGGTGGGGGEYAKITSVAVTPGNSYSFTVPAGGGAGANGSATSFSADAAAVTANGATGSTGGTGSTAPTHFNGGNGAGNGANAHGGGGGGSGGSAAAGNNGTAGNAGGAGATAVTGGGPGGAGGASISNPGLTPASGPGGGGGGGGATAGTGGSGYAGQVKLTYTTSLAPSANVLRFLLSVPSTGGTNGAVLARITTGGTVATLDITYGTGGTLTITGKNSVPATIFTATSGAIANGVPMMVSAELTTSGGNVAWAFRYIKPGDAASTLISSGTTAGSVGAISGNVLVNPGSTETKAVTVGHVSVQYALVDLSGLGQVINGHNGEYAADRFTRLCAESGIGCTLQGTNTDTPLMGPQPDDTLGNVLQQVEDIDRGLIYEPRTLFGLGYRTRKSMQNQAVALNASFTAAQLSPPLLPGYDDQLTRNDVTVSRTSGSSARYQLSSGAMSTLAPPNGVGDYTYTPTVNAHADSQLANLAQWIVTVGTVDDYRYPQVNFELARSETAVIGAAVAGLGPGDYFQITNPPSWLTASTVKQLAYGFRETLSQYQWSFQFNSIPEAPWEGAGLPTW